MVQPNKQAKFLGVTITQPLTWMPHVRSLITRARRATSMIKLLKGETWVTPRSLVHLTRALVRFRLTDGHEAFITTTYSLWLDLDRAELTAHKVVLGLPQEVGWLPLRQASGVPTTRPVPAQCQTLSGKSLERTLPLSVAFRRTEWPENVISCLGPQLPRLTSTSGNRARPGLTKWLPFPPWELEKSTVCHSLTGWWPHGQTDSLYLAILAMERVKEQLGNHLQIYTDGSVLQTEEVGCALVIPDLKITRRYKMPAGISIFTAELYVIYMACTIVNDSPNPPLGVAILSDSKQRYKRLEPVERKIAAICRPRFCS